MEDKKRDTAKHELYLEGAKRYYEEVAASKEGKDRWDLTVEDDEFIRQFFSAEKMMIKAGEFAKALLSSEDRLGEDANFYALKAFFLKLSCTDGATMDSFVKGVAEFARTENFLKISALFDDTEGFYEQRLFRDVDPIVEAVVAFTRGADLIEFDNLVGNFDVIFPVAREVIEERQKTGEPVLLSDFFSNYDYDKQEFRKSIYDLALERCEPLLTQIAKSYRTKAEIVSLTGGRASKVLFPLDKLHGILAANEKAFSGEEVKVNTMKRGSKKQAGIVFSFSTDEEFGGAMALSKNKNFKLRILSGVESLWAERCSTVDDDSLFSADENRDFYCTDNDLWAAMGYPNNPNTKDKAKLNEALTEMRRAEIHISNKTEVEAGYKTQELVYDGSYLPFERVRAKVNGNVTDTALHFFREPVVCTSARKRKQVTSFPVELLHSPVSKTEANIAIENYLIRRIMSARRAVQKIATDEDEGNVIRYEAIFKNAGITNRTQQYNKRKDIWAILDHIKENGYLSKYTKLKNGVKVHFS